MNSTLTATIYQADGRYLTDEELQPLMTLQQTHSDRLATYGLLEKQADALVNLTLDKMAQAEPAIAQHRSICYRDMSYVLRFIAVSILQDDEEAFVERLVLWMQNIMRAVHKEKQSIWAYQVFKTVISEKLPETSALLVNHLVQVFIDSLMAGD